MSCSALSLFRSIHHKCRNIKPGVYLLLNDSTIYTEYVNM